MTRAFTADRKRLATLRLAAQGIASPAFETSLEVARHLLAMQAQDFGGAKWGIGLRTRHATDADVELALANREIVRSWPMRGTLHITAAEDLGWMLGLTGERIVQSAAGRHRQLGLDDAAFALAARIATAELEKHQVVARSALLAAFDAGGLSTEGQRGAHILLYLCVTRLMVFGPVEGKQHSFVLLDDWVRTRRDLTGDEALAEFARRYFVSHGPASDRDFAWWSSLTLTQARRGIAAVADELDALEIEGVRYWHRAGLEPAAAGVVALPGFDEYVLGYQDRAAQLAPEWFERIVPGSNGMFLPTVVVNGEIVGTWKRTETTRAMKVAVVPFAPITVAMKPVFTRYSAFVGKPVKIV
jgi:hypothetical protein